MKNIFMLNLKAGLQIFILHALSYAQGKPKGVFVQEDIFSGIRNL